MDWVITIIVGGIVGWLASIVMRTNAQMGVVANVVIGVLGALLGRWLAAVMGLAVTGGVAAWIVSIVGAVLLIAILQAFGMFGRETAR